MFRGDINGNEEEKARAQVLQKEDDAQVVEEEATISF